MKFENESMIGKTVVITTVEQENIIGKIVRIHNSLIGSYFVVRTKRGDVEVKEDSILIMY